ncbi:hypothetical protein ACFQZT_28580 [Paenibacillus sp. GCM10027628]
MAISRQGIVREDLRKINLIQINWLGGGIHCITQQQLVFTP